MVLITLGSLRADVVGPTLTPHLDALAAEADLATRAVAPSSWALPSLASLATGLGPWLHGATEVGRADLAPELVTLAEALADRGYRGTAYLSGLWLRGDRGWTQGFVETHGLLRGARAEGHLASLAENRRQFLWIHVPEPEAPYVRRDGLVPPLPPALAARLPQRLTAAELEQWADPARPVPAERRQEIAALYRMNAAWADRRLGRLLDGLRASGQWDDTLLVVTSPNGEELGEYGSTGSSTSLGRVLLEVPLVVKLPRSLAGTVPPAASDGPVALTRVWATLVAAVGGPVPPAAGRGLFSRGAVPPGVLSELYLKNGYNELSLVERDGDVTRQLVWRSSFAPPEPEYYPARLATYRRGRSLAPPPAESPRRIFGRLTAAFETTLPLSGAAGRQPSLTLLRWTPDGSVEPVDDSRRRDVMAARLRHRWLAFQGCERTPAEESARRRRQAVAAGFR